MKNEITIGDCADVLKSYPDESIDCIVTDPPYGYSFMGLEWDRALPSLEALKECCRVLKPGAFGFLMCAPRMDVLWRMGQRLEEAGFRVDFSFIGWAFASGFTKASAIDKLIDKRNGRNQETYKPFAEYIKQKRLEKKLSMFEIDRILGTNTAYSWWEGRLSGIQLPSKFYYLQLKELLDLDSRFDELIKREEAKREVIKPKPYDSHKGAFLPNSDPERTQLYETAPATDKACEFEGASAGFQPKPALECIITVMKPLSEKTYVDQALSNGHGVSWLGNCRIPCESPHHNDAGRPSGEGWTKQGGSVYYADTNGRFPANLLCSDNCLDRGITTKRNPNEKRERDLTRSEFQTNITKLHTNIKSGVHHGDSGDFSRYFSLDAWFDKKLQELPEHIQKTFPFLITPKPSKSEKNKYIENKHPTVKPLKLMSYLITLGSREGDVILDPFAGSGTTLEACKLLNRVFIGIDKDPENEKYMVARGQLNHATLSDFPEVKS